jgi:hypothetical protein
MIEILTESDYKEALGYIDDTFIIINYMDVRAQREWLDLVEAVEVYEDENYPIGI